MKRKAIEEVPAKVPGKMPEDIPEEQRMKQVAAQLWGNYLILDLWRNGTWLYRHAMDINTGEYASLNADRQWTAENMANAFGDYWDVPNEGTYLMAEKDKKLVESILKIHWKCDIFERILSFEQKYAFDYREEKEVRRKQRICNLMNSIPEPGPEVYAWIKQKATGTLQYAIYYKEKDRYHCTACGEEFAEKAAGIRMKHKGQAVCPCCGHEVTVEKRRRKISLQTRLTMIQDVDKKQGVERHFEVTICWETAKRVFLNETIRCMLHRSGSRSKDTWKLYYRQNYRGNWDTGNTFNHMWKSSYLYPEGIRDGLYGTVYAVWMDVLPQMAAMGIRANYNRLLADRRDIFIQMVEYLFKGRFYRLLEEESENVSYMNGYGDYEILNVIGESIEEVMHLLDRQKINRLRQENGGTDMLEWLQWSDESGKKIRSDTMSWYSKNIISGADYADSQAAHYLSPEQLMNYLERQKTELGRRKAYTIFETYEDYLSMARKLGKNMADAMVYRPRELKRRHDELVEEYRKHLEALRLERDKEEARKKAEEMKQKYPGSEEILAEIKPKYEYEGEAYLVMVPQNFFQITMEGMALHHCVGNTERYFDRILQHETYICFLRRKEEPEKAFYTLEVEPGGTIRQHRGMFDEEPGIEEIKPFLREWQQELRSRLQKEAQEAFEKKHSHEKWMEVFGRNYI